MRKHQYRDSQNASNARANRVSEYADFTRMAENAGVADLLRLYNDYKKILDIGSRYMQEMYPVFTFITTNSST